MSTDASTREETTYLRLHLRSYYNAYQPEKKKRRKEGGMRVNVREASTLKVEDEEADEDGCASQEAEQAERARGPVRQLRVQPPNGRVVNDGNQHERAQVADGLEDPRDRVSVYVTSFHDFFFFSRERSLWLVRGEEMESK
jgi:hypothetical protein